MGKDLLEKRAVFKDRRIGDVTDIARAPPRAGTERLIVVAGTDGAAFLEPRTYTVRRFVPYAEPGPPFTACRVIDADGDGEVEFLRESGAGRDTGVYSAAGRLLCSHPPPGGSFPQEAHGDPDGDGKVDFLLWTALGARVELFDHRGATRWRQEWDRGLSEVLLVDTDQDGNVVARKGFLGLGTEYRQVFWILRLDGTVLVEEVESSEEFFLPRSSSTAGVATR